METRTSGIYILLSCIIWYINYTAVVQPVISSTVVGNAGAPQFTINTDRFSDDYGRVGVYKVIVVRGSQVDPSTIQDSQLAPAGVSQFK